mmetsp:Transcript_3215/g.3067  ORF Transcript_3215/g.3067 Transcript_3215/m.3067 type:complete len:326 (-) Transcript_3215:133-1110(-)|eukprot:CAMPEP_0197833862 /NCGR_PEP_ID=MMETSP1437-20131217/20363_1 /TAXON_ID=49252 ORGANISM="Eucampia antarctica, Strain CCMP1452" /NCGR_SAMPLE_ID=MMETSP1437 /ASSEMBLY_ACC=CAM_ASM_001096 /LENGTH=325 /DNA_ID=CAMNT_0043438155 /DNA_START=19 /DNA_END=996 /DNA_ORIENTATION=+
MNTSAFATFRLTRGVTTSISHPFSSFAFLPRNIHSDTSVSATTTSTVSSIQNHFLMGKVRENKDVSAMKRLLSTAAMSSGESILASFTNKSFEGTAISSAMEALAKADAVCFDVDSTVIQEEGIDVLADSLGKGKEVAEWTKKAMEGNTKFEDALAARLAIIEPSRQAIEKCLLENPLQLSPGIDTLIEALNERGTDVYLVSGGFRIMIEPLAKDLCISKHNIVANTILFDESGNYTGFDKNEPTSADMGKPKAVQQIKDQFGYETIVMVGDGATDAQAKPPADAFVGFGGVAVRDAVRNKACWYVYDFEDMITVVKQFGKKRSL